MSAWEDRPPMTRREARERERRAALRAVTEQAEGPVPGDAAEHADGTGPADVAKPSTPAAEPGAGAAPRRPEPSFDALIAPDDSTAPTDPDSRTLTRRELRALRREREQREAAATASDTVAEPNEPTSAGPLPTPEYRPHRAEHGGGAASGAPESGPTPAAPSAAEAGSAPTNPVPGGRAPHAVPDAAPGSPPPGGKPAADTRTGPRGAYHWSDKDHEDASSGTSTASNALILPDLPKAPATGPLTSTGEVLVTGSIDLPRSLGSTGRHPRRFDSPEIDALLDQQEDADGGDSAPVRASSAVSSHSSTRGTIAPPKAGRGRLTVALIVTASVLAVGVIGLLAVSIVMRVL